MEQKKKKSKAGLYLGFIALILLIVLGLIYYILLGAQNSVLGEMGLSEFSVNKSEMDAKDVQIKRLESEARALRSEKDNVSLTLGYMIKPIESVVSECHTLRVGKWDINQKCQQALIKGLKKTLEDKKVVAIEVSGIVDTRPYGGLSPELKQEGLASFRAREAMMLVRKNAPNIAVFEGLSKQLRDKRGFVIKAYYVVKN